MSRFFLIISILCLGCGCGLKNSRLQDAALLPSVNIPQSERITDRPALKIDYAVQLQTTDEALLGEIAEIVPYDNYLFILTALPQNDVFVFSSDGTFLRKLSKGRAKNELLYPTSIAIDEASGRLLVLDLYRYVKEFTAEGVFCGQETFQEPQMSVESVGENGAVMLYNQMSSMNPDNGHNCYVKMPGKSLQGIYKCPFREDAPWGAGYLTKCNQDSVLLCPYFSDTIYLYSSHRNRCDPFLVFDFRGKSANEPSRLKRYTHIGDYDDAVKSGMYSGPRNVYFMNGKIFAAFSGKDLWLVYDTFSGKSSTYDRMFDDLPNYYGSGGQDGGHVLFPYESHWLKKHFEEHPPLTRAGKNIAAMCRNENDNPILVFAGFND